MYKAGGEGIENVVDVRQNKVWRRWYKAGGEGDRCKAE
jgi:hypothetical protein